MRLPHINTHPQRASQTETFAKSKCVVLKKQSRLACFVFFWFSCIMSVIANNHKHQQWPGGRHGPRLDAQLMTTNSEKRVKTDLLQSKADNQIKQSKNRTTRLVQIKFLIGLSISLIEETRAANIAHLPRFHTPL